MMVLIVVAGVLLGAGASLGEGQEETVVILINPFEVPAGKLEEAIAMWEQARDYLQTQPGYVSTALHQSLVADARYRLINVAKWENAEAYTAATKKMRQEAGLPTVEGVVPDPALYTVVRRD
ncbi:MAG: antibiotic biosynthesis monooxygenase family protein [Acidobacteriota bacterium]